MFKASLASFLMPVAAAIVLGPLTSTGWSVRPFQNAFYALYLSEESDDPDDRMFAKLVRDEKCNLCHIGNRKKDRNTYGIELSKLLDHVKDKGNAQKARNALQRVSRRRSDPTD